MRIITKEMNKQFKLTNDVSLKIIGFKGKNVILGFNAPDYKLANSNSTWLNKKAINDKKFAD